MGKPLVFRMISARVGAVLGVMAGALLPLTAVVAAPPDIGPRPAPIPWAFAPDLEGVEATSLHAAGLGFMPSFELALTGSVRLSDVDGGPRTLGAPLFGPGYPSAFGGLVGGRLGPLAAGLGVYGFEGASGMTARVDFGLAWQLNPLASIGFQTSALYDRDEPLLDHYWSWGLSATLRPFRALATTLSFGNINGPTAAPVAGHDGPVVRLGLGLRPFGEVGQIGFEGARSTGGEGFWQAGLHTRWWLVPGLSLGAVARYTVPDDGFRDDTVEVGLTVGLSQGGWGLDAAVDVHDPAGAATASTSFLLRTRAQRLPSLAAPDNIVLRIAIDGPLPERPTTGLLGESGPGFAHWLLALEAASRDPDVKAVVMQIGSAPNWAQCWELREVVKRLRARGKKVFAGLVVADMRAMYLAAAADEVWLFASGGMTLTGLAVTQSYYFELLKKIGVSAEFIAFEEYKSFPEVATRTAPSDPAREQSRRILDVIQATWTEAVAGGRGLTAETLGAVVANGPQSMHDAKAAGLADELVEADAWSDLLRERLGPFDLVNGYTPWPRGSRRWGSRRHIAVVPVVGSIVDGQSSGALPLPLPFVGGATTGDRTFIQALETAVNDPDAVGVVVRVDSGGGSVTASDRMHRAVAKLSKRKPIVVSFGNAAASGGYYLAAGAPKILATPNTVTGSIGIFTGKANLSELYRIIGVDHHTEKTTDRADMLGDHRGFTEDEKARAGQVLRAYYDRFLGVVADGRKLAPEKVAALARGRVWIGSDAIDNGLVDAAGGLYDAMVHIAAESGHDLADLDVRYHGSLGALSGLQRLAASVLGLPLPTTAAPLNPDLQAIADALVAISSLDIGAPLAIMPFTLRID